MTARRRARRDAPEVAERPVALIPGPQRLILDDFPTTDVSRALSPNGRMHWATRGKMRAWVATTVYSAAEEQGLHRVDAPVRLLFRYVYPDRRKRDVDNLATGVTKAAIDALVRGEWLVADDSEHVTEVKAVAVVEKGSRRLEIEIQEV